MNSFSESQRFTQWWLWTIIIGVMVLSTSSVFFAAPKGGKADVPLVAILSTIAVPLLILLLFLTLKLKTTINETGISYQFLPIHFKPVTKTWAEIDKAYVRQYSPLREYGGWGIRYGFGFGNGKAYNVSGNMGLQIIFKDGKKLLLGTQKPDEINETLRLLVRNGKIGNNTISP